MPLFSSARERRLWITLAAVLIAIYSTLGLARILAGELRNRGLLDGFFVFCFALVIASFVAQGLRLRAGGLEIFVGLGIVAVYFMVFTRMAIPEERTHLVEYGVVGGLVFEALSERALQGRRVPYLTLLAMAITTALGAFDECLQAVIPNRVFDWRDILFNTLAGTMAIVAIVALKWARKRAAGFANKA